jgi:hypothetical protein
MVSGINLSGFVTTQVLSNIKYNGLGNGTDGFNVKVSETLDYSKSSSDYQSVLFSNPLYLR